MIFVCNDGACASMGFYENGIYYTKRNNFHTCSDEDGLYHKLIYVLCTQAARWNNLELAVIYHEVTKDYRYPEKLNSNDIMLIMEKARGESNQEWKLPKQPRKRASSKDPKAQERKRYIDKMLEYF